MLATLAVIVVVAIGALRRRTGLLAVAASWTLFAAVAVLGPWLPLDTGTPESGITIAVANALNDNPSPSAAADDILAVDADIVVVPEANGAVHRALARRYPFEHRNPGVYGTRTGVYARVPARLLPPIEGLFDGDRYARVRIGGDEPFVLWALHLPRPWLVEGRSHQMRPRRHARLLDRITDAIADEDLPVVVAGDLNLTDRGRGYRRLTADLDDAMRSIGGQRTSLKPLFRPLLLRIDHILEPEDWCADGARRFDISGSDHRGVTARVGRCASR